ncbi:MAG: YqgE/AlgH family protein [Reichenbachiella sp.]
MDYFHSIQSFKPERGDLLISEPYLPDPNFERTVILLCSHDENGSFGYVLNQVSQVVFEDLVKDIEKFKEKIFIGGPVQQDTLHFLHRSENNAIGGEPIAEDIIWGGDYNYLLELIKTEKIDAKNFKFFVGYSGWSAGQLEEELAVKSWIVYKNASTNQIFDIAPDALWKTVLEELGGKFKMISKYPTDPRLN